MQEWRPIEDVIDLPHGTVADLRMRSGRIYRAVFGFRGSICAWWPTPGQARKSLICTLQPAEVAVVRLGDVPRDDWKSGHAAQHAAF